MFSIWMHFRIPEFVVRSKLFGRHSILEQCTQPKLTWSHCLKLKSIAVEHTQPWLFALLFDAGRQGHHVWIVCVDFLLYTLTSNCFSPAATLIDHVFILMNFIYLVCNTSDVYLSKTAILVTAIRSATDWFGLLPCSLSLAAIVTQRMIV